jgi:hypothetical protein
MRVRTEPDWPHPDETLVLRGDDTPVSLAAFNSLMTEFARRFPELPDDATKIAADKWLAPRLHWALRLTRRQAADKNLWLWLALRNVDYVEKRWGENGFTDRWYGPMSKQAFARLWWTSEIFRQPGNYTAVERAMQMHAVPNQVATATFARSRAFAQAVLNLVIPTDPMRRRLTQTEVFALSKVINLAVAGTSPEVEIDDSPDDVGAYLAWTREPLSEHVDWEPLPEAPHDFEISPQSASAAETLGNRCWSYLN